MTRKITASSCTRRNDGHFLVQAGARARLIPAAGRDKLDVGKLFFSFSQTGARAMAAQSTTQPVPSVVPYLMVNGADAAISFYKKAFGATEVMRLTDPAGRIAHAQVKIGEAPVMLAEETKEWGNRSPQTLGGTPVIIDLNVADVDAVVARAVAAGAKLVFPVADQFYGFRSGRISDPFGHVWIVSTQKENLTTEEMQQRFDAMMKK